MTSEDEDFVLSWLASKVETAFVSPDFATTAQHPELCGEVLGVCGEVVTVFGNVVEICGEIAGVGGKKVGLCGEVVEIRGSCGNLWKN